MLAETLAVVGIALLTMIGIRRYRNRPQRRLAALQDKVILLRWRIRNQSERLKSTV